MEIEEKVVSLETEENDNSVENEETVGSPTHSCLMCHRQFSCTSSQRRHLRLVHHVDTTNLNSKPLNSCPLCSNFKFMWIKDFHHHLELEHGIKLEPKYFEFKTFEAFEKWKEEIETTTNALFVKTHKYSVRSNTCKLTYRCSRSGYYTPRGSGRRSLKRQGTSKLNAMCPAYIEILMPKGKRLKVTFIDTHCGHGLNDLRHIHLTKKDKFNIAKQLKQGMEIDEILDSMRENSLVPAKRKHLVTRKDLRNIRESFKIPKLATCKLSSVEEWVNEVHQSEQSPVLLFKQQDTESSIKGLAFDDFCLIVMTEQQKVMLNQYGNSYICLDSTTLRECDFALTTLMVIDNNQVSFPAAFLFSNKHEMIIYKTFFETLKACVGNLTPQIFMSDNTDVYYHAWEMVMGEVPTRLLNTWHVIRSWERKLYLIKAVDRQRGVLDRLKACQSQTDMDIFVATFPPLILELQNDPVTEPYGDYLLTEYGGCLNFWATCYTKSLAEVRNVSFDLVRKVFKNNYQEGKLDRRLDKPIRALVELAEQNEVKIPRRRSKGMNKTHVIKIRHKESMGYDGCISCHGSDENPVWYIRSGPDTMMYEVKINVECDCKIRCKECNKCIHAYSCTCEDYMESGNMCVHVHQLCMQQNSPERSETLDATENLMTFQVHMQQDGADNVETYNATENLMTFQVIEVNENIMMELEATDPENAQLQNQHQQEQLQLQQQLEHEHELEVQRQQEKNQRIEALKSGFEKFLESCSTLEHVDIVEKGLESLQKEFLSTSIESADAT